MNVLEHLVEEELTRVPQGPSGGELRRRAHVRRARRTASVVAVAMVFGVLGIAAMLRSPASHRVQVTEPALTSTSSPSASTTTTIPSPDSRLPLATTAEFPPLQKMLEAVTGTVMSDKDPKAVVDNPSSAEIVATTDTRAFALWGGTQDGKLIYVVQVTGRFVCSGCSVPVGAGSPRGGALQSVFAADGSGTGFGLTPQPVDLSQLGTVYRLPLPVLSTESPGGEG